jgi:tetratricopeptide (TPR) repeat protein
MRRALVDLAELRQEKDTWAPAAFELAAALNDQPEAVPWCVLAVFWADQDRPVRREATALLARLAGPPPRRRTAVLRRFFPTAALVSDGYAAVAASDRYDSTEDPADLDLAIRLWQHQLAVGPPDSVPAVLERLADAHRHRYIELEELADLNAEIAARRVCLHMLPEGEHKETLRTRQTESLRQRFAVTDMPPNETEYGSEGGVHALRECGLIAGLSALRSRDFDQAWRAFDLLEAARSARSDKQPADERKIRAALYHMLSKDTRRTADLRLAIFLYRELLAEDEAAADVLNGLGTALYEAAGAGVRDGDLDEAVVLLRRAHAMEVDHDELAAMIKFNLGNALMLLHRKNKDLAVLDEGIALHREALEVFEEDSPNGAHIRETLDEELRVRAHHLGQTEMTNAVDDVLFDLKEVQLDAMSALFNGTEVRRRLEHQWANSDQDAAVAVAESLFDTISTVMWLLSPSDRIERIGRMQNAASDAAALFLRAGMPEQAVEILEHGRNLQWSQQLRAQHEIAALREYRPDIADELESIFQSHLPGIEISVPRTLNDRSIGRRWEEAIEEARRVEGFAGFLDALPYDVLRKAGAEGPVVIVNLSSLRCDAIIINEDKLTVVELTVDEEACSDKIADFVATVDSLEFLGTERDDLWTKANDRVRDLIQLLSTDIVAPVLARLAVEDRPRVWWCPTGMLTFAPLHVAAGDQVVSSYTQNLTALLTARECRHDEPVSLLIASVPKSESGRTALRAAEAEVNIVSGAITPQLHLHGPAATTADVQHSLSEHTWFHFAGHGGTPAITVLDGKHVRLSTDSGGLWLHDGPLEPKDIVAHELHHVELVVVSACKSAASDVFRFNESLHPSGALQAAGCQQVVASLWAVSDFVIPDFVDVLYRRLTENGIPDARFGAHAVHDAVSRLREEYPDDPLLWISFIHIGI